MKIAMYQQEIDHLRKELKSQEEEESDLPEEILVTDSCQHPQVTNIRPHPSEEFDGVRIQDREGNDYRIGKNTGSTKINVAGGQVRIESKSQNGQVIQSVSSTGSGCKITFGKNIIV
jgi:hypothetical protein